MRDKSKVIALVALIIAVVGLGIGFAAFSSQLTISSGATVTPNKSDWNVAFDTTYNTVGYDCTTEGGATITSNPTVQGTTISGLEVAFTEPSQYITCIFRVANTGKYKAYLTKMEFENSTLNCEVLEETDARFPAGYTRADDDLVASACDYMYATMYDSVAWNEIYAEGDLEIKVTEGESTWASNGDDLYLIEETGTLDFELFIHYFDDAPLADGPFVVEIPDINLTFSTVDVAP